MSRATFKIVFVQVPMRLPGGMVKEELELVHNRSCRPVYLFVKLPAESAC